ncbi:shikimate dehydrogenase [Arthrobacter sp. OY3WO11]|uniref:shikimate dehydrogenase n=1 Tax=Arthrobacter sp. OY3WO11 TaxID=1835723 RepID=UPI0007D01387|nr:shikimate dehydrogenase [Arthrobacter sp. OY3WO11]OAE00104.1 shikimate dehydrogenase [Arthrobacter sp. OY3WO11]
MSTPAESYLVGLIGEGTTHSLTPALHEREADQHGLRYIYRTVDLTVLARPAGDVGALLSAGRDLGFNAFNITVPAKQVVLEYLDDLSDDAARLGAVNTVLIHDGKFIGHNTDYSGFGSALEEGLPGASLGRVAQLGAGGAGAATAYALLAAGAEHLYVLDLDPARSRERAAALAGHFPDRIIEWRPMSEVADVMSDADGLVHATPVGMHAHPGMPLDGDLLQPRHWVADIVYRPIETGLLKAAAAKGCRVLDGGHMAVGQAVDAFRLITGVEPDRPRMREHFLSMLRQGA